ncbi:MAG: restriction endonuclease subunit S [Gammaproteobacteria bacterium]|nr:restriction endonuclease subunit S [Gammaproteobacteria bacterium]
MKLKDIATLQLGYPFRGKVQEADSSNVCVVQLKNVSRKNGIDIQQCSPVILSGKKKPNYLQNDDILFVARGSHNYAIIVDNIDTQPFRFVAMPHFFVIRVHDKKVLPSFLSWQINRLPIQQYLQSHAVGSVVTSINRKTLENMPVRIPPLEEQQHIVSVADTLHRQRTILQQLINNNENIMNGIAQKL